MTDSVQISKLGIPFGLHAIYQMRWFMAEFPKDETWVLIWYVARDANNQLQLALAADPTPPATSREDEIDGIRYYLLGKEEDIEIVRQRYYLDYDRNKKKLKLTELRGHKSEK